MIIVDTGFWFGLLDRRDQYHSACYSFLSICEEPLITTFPVLTESMHLLINRGYPQQGLSLWKTLQQLHQLGKFSTFSLTDEHLPRLQQLLEQYQSLPMDLADASLVLLAEHLGHGRIVSTDERFSNLPLETALSLYKLAPTIGQF